MEAQAPAWRLTSKGQVFRDLVETNDTTLAPLSRYLHDVLLMCGSGMWFDQMRQFMPPHSLRESLQTLQLLGLLEPSDGRVH
ncbi:hypothetical protein [Ramlibacter sp. PS4R-6]|uniref:hypothetical protein n=1 Tax=Ramlibacter sp. PS4R-6 TaxID=3133438 RepID=UPI0030ADA1AA